MSIPTWPNTARLAAATNRDQWFYLQAEQFEYHKLELLRPTNSKYSTHTS